MKKISSCLLGIALTAGFSMPAAGMQVIPSLFAPAFCAARRIGMSIREASRYGVRMSTDSSRPEAVKIDGVSIDIRLAVDEAAALCPDAFRSGISARQQGLTTARTVLQN
jgi:hypothetical protein